MNSEKSEIKRHGRTILLGDGRTATEGHDGLPTLVFRSHGKITHTCRGSSLVFGSPLTEDDKKYLQSLADK